MLLKLAHQIWKGHIKAGDRAIDATAGNGHDTVFLATLSLSQLYAFDIQSAALEATRKRMEKFKNISFHLECHSQFKGVEGKVELIVYNLGYLPGSDKRITTQVKTTMESVNRGIEILSPGGLMSITLYPGHEEGAREEKSLLSWAETLPFQVSHHRLLNRSQAPSLILIKKQ